MEKFPKLQDYRTALKTAQAGDFVYLDLPCDGTWNEYQAGGFTAADQKDLTQVVNDLTRAGVLVMLSNSNTERIRDLYSRYHVQVVRDARSIFADGNREMAEEVMVTNYIPGECLVMSQLEKKGCLSNAVAAL